MIEQTSTPQTYPALLASIKERIQRAQVRAAVAVNQELVLLYWSIGKEILTQQHETGLGQEQIAKTRKGSPFCTFPHMKGLSRSNLCI